MYSNVKLEPILDSIEYIEMSDEEYFSPKWADYISNSRLKSINPDEGGSYEKFEEGLQQIRSDSLVIGSAVHELVLQPDEFELIPTIDRPTAKAGLMADELYPYANDEGIPPLDSIIKASQVVNYYKDKLDSQKINALLAKISPYIKARKEFESNRTSDKVPIYLDPKSRDKVRRCVESLTINKDIQALLHPVGFMDSPISMNEAALFMNMRAILDDQELILPLKGKLDNFTWDVECGELVLNDLKTTGHLCTEFDNSFEQYHYSRQMAYYLYMLRLWCEKEHQVKPTNMKANMLVVSTIPDYYSRVYKVSNKQIMKGFNEFKSLLQRVAYGRFCRGMGTHI